MSELPPILDSVRSTRKNAQGLFGSAEILIFFGAVNACVANRSENGLDWFYGSAAVGMGVTVVAVVVEGLRGIRHANNLELLAYEHQLAQGAGELPATFYDWAMDPDPVPETDTSDAVLYDQDAQV